MAVRSARPVVVAGLAAIVLAACATPRPHVALRRPAPSSSAPTRTDPPIVTVAPTSAPPGDPTTSVPATPLPELPRGGRQILPTYRVVAYYGAAGTSALGVLGQGTPDQAAAAIEDQAAGYARFGRPVQPAMELLATVAQRAPGADGNYSAPVPDSEIERYLAAAHRHRMLLILDIQPGRGEFLPEVQHLAPFLADPSVSIALDPEWKVGPQQLPGHVIGAASAASINAVAEYLHGIVTAAGLPDKLLVVELCTFNPSGNQINVQAAE